MKNLSRYKDFLNEDIDLGDLTKNREFLNYVEKKWGKDYTNIECQDDLNQGYCILVTDYIKDKYKDSEIFTIGHPTSYHVFAKIEDKYYDGVNTKGVKRIEDLDWVEKRSKINPNVMKTLQKGIPYTN